MTEATVDPPFLSATATRAAQRVLRDLDGTLCRDLRTLMKWAGEFGERKANDQTLSDLGALNFTLMMVALVGCETLGFYTEGAAKHVAAIREKETRLPDPGIYLMAFVQRYFPKGSMFKKLVKVLADELRHDLVHGFGSLGRQPGVRLAIAVKADTAVDLRVAQRRGKPTLAINAIAFAAAFLAAFDQVRDRLASGSDPRLTANIARASRLRFPVNTGVRHQFDVVYDEATRKGMTATLRRSRGR